MWNMTNRFQMWSMTDRYEITNEMIISILATPLFEGLLWFPKNRDMQSTCWYVHFLTSHKHYRYNRVVEQYTDVVQLANFEQLLGPAYGLGVRNVTY